VLKGYVHPDFKAVAKRFEKQIPKGRYGGAAVCVYFKGEKVVDVWSGTKNRQGEPWQEDTLALSFSTTKGVASTLMHILVGKGLANYDDPIAKHWPEFAAQGKENITIRQAMHHGAGLYLLEDHIDDGHDILDWHKTLAGMAAAKPAHTPGKGSGYHGMNYGHLMGGIIEGITSKTFAQVLLEELSEPLALDGCYVGLPIEAMDRRAHLITRNGVYFKMKKGAKPKGIMKYAKFFGINFRTIQKTLMPASEKSFSFNDEDLVKACIPAANGMFTARSLAKMYAMLANKGELNGLRLIPEENFSEIGKVYVKTRDRVIGLPMHWRLGYHRLFAVGAKAPLGYAHFGFGGSGACCDPERNISIAMTLNSGVGTPMGDSRTPFIIGAALRSADKVLKRSGELSEPVPVATENTTSTVTGKVATDAA
jgi:CubicO group peptidase (beta-lactamase class C family)